MAEKYKVKPDAVLKEFWRKNERFADLVNAALFDGKQVIGPDALSERDTDLSSVLQFKGHAETLVKVLDVVKKSAFGIDFAIIGIENQMKVHYAMPLRHMIGDALGYLKEYTELVQKNKKNKDQKWGSEAEFLSGLNRGDRLHPMITICVYYGEDPWDGPLSLTDMLEVPEELKGVVSDYRMNLVQVRESDNLVFRDPDVAAAFSISRSIFRKEFKQIEASYRDTEIDAEVGLMVGAITESRELIEQALNRKGGTLNMCNALTELKQEGIEQGKRIMVIKLLQQALLPDEAIASAAELTMEQLQEIKEQMAANSEI